MLGQYAIQARSKRSIRPGGEAETVTGLERLGSAKKSTMASRDGRDHRRRLTRIVWWVISKLGSCDARPLVRGRMGPVKITGGGRSESESSEQRVPYRLPYHDQPAGRTVSLDGGAPTQGGHMDRRAFLAGSVVALETIAASSARAQPAASLPAGFVRLRVVPGELTVDGKVGKAYRIEREDGRLGWVGRRGGRFQVALDNGLADPLSIHWHGLILPDGQDQPVPMDGEGIGEAVVERDLEATTAPPDPAETPVLPLDPIGLAYLAIHGELPRHYAQAHEARGQARRRLRAGGACCDRPESAHRTGQERAPLHVPPLPRCFAHDRRRSLPADQ